MAGLARACGITQPSVSDWFNGRTQALEGQNLVAAANYLRVNPEWLATGKGQRSAEATPRLKAREASPSYLSGMARTLSHEAFTLPPSLTWEQLMQSIELPERFVVESPDDALAPNLPRGTAVVFERVDRAEPGDCVLVEDKRGARYMRRYAQGVGGVFFAQAINEVYASLSSDEDGLRVLAVMAWRAERRV